MVYLLILLGLAVVVAPLLSAMPSKGQRRKAALRDAARQYGLRVSIRPPPDIPPRFRFAPDAELVCYERMLPNGLQAPGRQCRYVRLDNEWRSIFDDLPAPDWVHRLPEGAVVAELTERNASIFWDERGALEDLATLHQAIELISESGG